jgi:hypothetical protein
MQNWRSGPRLAAYAELVPGRSLFFVHFAHGQGDTQGAISDGARGALLRVVESLWSADRGRRVAGDRAQPGSRRHVSPSDLPGMGNGVPIVT